MAFNKDSIESSYFATVRRDWRKLLEPIEDGIDNCYVFLRMLKAARDVYNLPNIVFEPVGDSEGNRLVGTVKRINGQLIKTNYRDIWV